MPASKQVISTQPIPSIRVSPSRFYSCVLFVMGTRRLAKAGLHSCSQTSTVVIPTLSREDEEDQELLKARKAEYQYFEELQWIKSTILPKAGATKSKKYWEQEALNLFQDATASEKPLVIALAVCGFFNEFGLGTNSTPSYSNAELFYNRAAKLNCGFAQARLAFLKSHGRPGLSISSTAANSNKLLCQKHPLLATCWIYLLASCNIPAAQFCLALCYYNGIALPKNSRLCFDWCYKAATLGQAGAMNVIGNIYSDESTTSSYPIPDPILGLKWYIKAAELRDAAAIYNIGTLFEKGAAGLPASIQQAFEWYSRASVFGSINAQNVLGIFHEQGLGTDPNPTRAVQYYNYAAKFGHPHAMYNLARCYHDGFGVAKDNTTALLWFDRGAEQNHVLSLVSAAICFEAGIGMYSCNRKTAYKYYRRAASKGAIEAINRMRENTAVSLYIAAKIFLSGKIRHEKYKQRTYGQYQREYFDNATQLLLKRIGTLLPTKEEAEGQESPGYSFGAFTGESGDSFDTCEMEFSRYTPPPSPIMYFGPNAFSKKRTIGRARQANITMLPTEIIIEILKYVNEFEALEMPDFLRVVNYAGVGRSVGFSSKKELCLMLGVVERAKWVGNDGWCDVCDGKKCEKIRHYLDKLD